MAKITEVRLTLAAFIYGVEIDLKNVIKKNIAPFHEDIQFFHDTELEAKVLERFNKENPGIDYKKNVEDIVDFLDFGDTFVILKKNNVFLSKQANDFLNSIYEELVTVIPVRNRVMHTRPLLGGDFAIVYDFITKLKLTDPIEWKATIETRSLIEKDPSYVLTLKFPTSSFTSLTNKVIHNLPVPDFDETGFIGRTKDVDDTKQLIFTNKVVSVLGDGGIGKTALALKVAYDIVDLNEKCPFELIIWTTAKTTMLTAKGIEEIYTAITDYTGLIDMISETMDSKIQTNKLDSILEYLDLFKTLIIIDNLETIHNEEVRDFIRKAQVKCHILITSRIGLGELEFPRKLNGLTENESSKLIREIARIRNSETLMKLPQKTLVEISEKLYFNPLALKWFVSTVEMGVSPAEVLSNKEDLLNFCLTNVYEKLSDGAIAILKTIRASRRKLTTGEIIYLSNFQPLEVRKYLIELFKTTLISREIKDANNLEEVYYYISDFAKDFLSKKYQIEPEYVKALTKKYKVLEDGLKDITKYSRYNEFSINALSYETANQKIAAKFLSEALGYSKSSDFDRALQKIQEAKNIDPNYYEVYRVSAFIKATQGDILSAEEDYQMGLEIAPKNLRLLFYYAQFLLFSLEDSHKALQYAEQVYQQKPNHPYTSLLFARCYNHNRDFNKAIQILRTLLANTELDPKNKRITYTELISLYSNTGQSLLRVETDIENAVNHYKKAFETFEECIAKNIIDYKVLKNFVDCLYSFINNLPTTEIEKNRAFIKGLMTKFETQISLTYLCTKVILKYSNKFHDDDFNHLIGYEVRNDKIIGNVRRGKIDSNFVFIEGDSAEYYANRYDFIDIHNWTDWKNLKNGQLVTFEKGTNAQGDCAKNIKILN
ncbi:MAG: tetratricopeptide repeat protein [Cyclobacteriaceae bacterium]|nr:tetratricopeptide repeat protein [Cyclobacteriaceae bacterium]